MAGSRRRWLRTGKKHRFVPGRGFGTDRGLTVHPVRVQESVCGGHELCAAHTTRAVSNHQRAEEQVVQNQHRESRRFLADAGWEQQQPPGSSPVRYCCCVVLARRHADSLHAPGTHANSCKHAFMMLTAHAQVMRSGCCCRPSVDDFSPRDAARCCISSHLMCLCRVLQRKLLGGRV